MQLPVTHFSRAAATSCKPCGLMVFLSHTIVLQRNTEDSLFTSFWDSLLIVTTYWDTDIQGPFKTKALPPLLLLLSFLHNPAWCDPVSVLTWVWCWSAGLWPASWPPCPPWRFHWCPVWWETCCCPERWWRWRGRPSAWSQPVRVRSAAAEEEHMVLHSSCLWDSLIWNPSETCDE